MGEKVAGILGSKGDGYLFTLWLEVSYRQSSSVSILQPVLLNAFINDSKEKSEFTRSKTANDTKPGSHSQSTHRQRCHPGGPRQAGGTDKAKPWNEGSDPSPLPGTHYAMSGTLCPVWGPKYKNDISEVQCRAIKSYRGWQARPGLVQPEEGKALWDLASWRKMEPGSSQRYTVRGWVKIRDKLKQGNFKLDMRRNSSTWGQSSSGTSCPGGPCRLCPWRFSRYNCIKA